MHKRIVFLFFCLFLGSISARSADGESSFFQEQIIWPVFNDRGELVFIYRTTEGKTRLGLSQSQAKEPVFTTFELGTDARSSRLKKDREGTIWVLWEEWARKRSRVLVGPLLGGALGGIQRISQEEGFNYSPEMGFDSQNSPWIVWTNYQNGQYGIFVQDLLSGRLWRIYGPSSTPPVNPRMIFDLKGQAWVFWSSKDRGEEEIFYRIFDQKRWSPPGRIIDHPEFPSVNPDVGMDARGFIWLVWSGYDGENYEIYCSSWDGSAWSEKMKITESDLGNNVFPSLTVTSRGVPVVVWTSSSERGSRACLKYFENGAWSGHVEMMEASSGLVIPKIVVQEDKIGLAYQDGHGIHTLQLSLAQIKQKYPLAPNPSQPWPAYFSAALPSRLLYNSNLRENIYVGFGDSITYGYINRRPVPEKGYIPRLDALLDQEYGATYVINEGVSGEHTIGGLSRIDDVLRRNNGRYLLLLEGTNDVALADHISPETSAFNLREMVRKCLQSGVFPAIGTIPPRLDYDFYRDRILYLNKLIQQIAEDLLIPRADQHSVFWNYPELQGGLAALLSEDRKHPSEKGYQVIAETWFQQIRDYPFPPVNVRIREEWLRGLSPRKLGNQLSWQVNPKVQDQSRTRGYYIYRKLKGEEDVRFKLLTFVSSAGSYFDLGIDPAQVYAYVVSALRSDGVEGPAAEPHTPHLRSAISLTPPFLAFRDIQE